MYNSSRRWSFMGKNGGRDGCRDLPGRMGWMGPHLGSDGVSKPTSISAATKIAFCMDNLQSQ